MKNNFKKIVGISFVIIGICVILSPMVMNFVTNKQMEDKITDFFKDNSHYGKDYEDDELYQKLKEYNDTLYINGQKIVDAFSYKDISVNLKDFGYEENIIGSITIPKIDVHLPIYLGATETNLYKGATHLSQTSIPIGGNNTNSVIAAHRGLIRNKMFRHLDKLEQGDEIIINNLWDELVYKVVETKVIEPDEIDQVLIQEGKDMVTLFTCHPFRINSHRYVVYCERSYEN